PSPPSSFPSPPPPRALHSFPTRRSSDLRRDRHVPELAHPGHHLAAQSPGTTGDHDPHEELPVVVLCLHHALVVRVAKVGAPRRRSEEHTSELQSRFDLVCRLLLEKKKRT